VIVTAFSRFLLFSQGLIYLQQADDIIYKISDVLFVRLTKHETECDE
jgi:hypothetical protein